MRAYSALKVTAVAPCFINLIVSFYRNPSRSTRTLKYSFLPVTTNRALFSEEEGVCTTVLVRFCSEGDNTGEATDLALYLNRWKRLFPVAADKNPPLDYPVSWRHLFGNPVPASIY